MINVDMQHTSYFTKPSPSTISAANSVLPVYSAGLTTLPAITP